MTIPIIWFIVEAYLPAVRWLLNAPGIQSVLGILFLLGSYTFLYWCYLVITRTNVIRIMPFRVWGDSENRYNAEGLATRLRDEIQKLQNQVNKPSKTKRELSSETESGLQFITDKVENLPPAEVRIDYHGISLDRINSYLRRRLFIRETFITGDLIIAEDRLYLATRSLGKGPWEGVVTTKLYDDLQKGLERMAILIAVTLYPESVGGIANVLINRQDKLDAANDFRESLRYALLHLELEPDSALAHSNLGVSYKDNSRLDDAIRQFEKAVELDTKNSTAHNNLGAALADSGETENAIIHYTEAIELDPKLWMPHYNLGNAFREQGDPEKAILHYNKAIKLKPSYSEAHNNLGVVHQAQGNPEKALLCFKKAVESGAKNSQAHANLAGALAEQGDIEGAILHYNKAIKLKPGFAPAYYDLGFALLRAGRKQEAVVAFEKAKELDPTLEIPEAQKSDAEGVKMKKKNKRRKPRKD